MSNITTNCYDDVVHQWRLEEPGYVRTWTTTVDTDDQRIVAVDAGHSDDGDGVELVCTQCGTRVDVPDEWRIDFS